MRAKPSQRNLLFGPLLMGLGKAVLSEEAGMHDPVLLALYNA